VKDWVVLTVLSAVAVGVGACAGTGAHGETLGSAVGKAAGAVIGHQHGQTGIGSGIGSDLGGVAGSAISSSREGGKPPADKSPAHAVRAKFCPTGGERYSDSLHYCPIHGDALQLLTE